jgi:hypothetical protein
MNLLRVAGASVFALIMAFPALPVLRAESPALLPDVHKLLQQAAGDSPDSVPAADQQRALLEQALDLIHHIPHVYHGELKQATRDIETALNEVSSGDPTQHARSDILEADDLIKALINS